MMVKLNQTTWLPDHHLLLDNLIAWTTVPWLQMVADHGMLSLPLAHKHSEELNHQQLELLLKMLNKSKTCQNNQQVNITDNAIFVKLKNLKADQFLVLASQVQLKIKPSVWFAQKSWILKGFILLEF